MIIGLGHTARSGKDTVAEHLRLEHGFSTIAFASALKQGARAIFGLSEEQVSGDLKEVVDSFWDDTPRSILQKMGTECMRAGYLDDLWVKCVERAIEVPTDERWVISDVRFLNEARAVKNWGGYLVKVDRPGGPEIEGSQHSSEVAMSEYQDWDYVLTNDGTLSDLYEKVNQMILEFVRGKYADKG